MDDCILWKGAVTSSGYGSRTVNGRWWSAHRHAWIEAFGEIPFGQLVLHRCDVKTCINPQHLFLGTHKENTQDAIRKGRFKHPTRGKKMSESYKAKLSALRKAQWATHHEQGAHRG